MFTIVRFIIQSNREENLSKIRAGHVLWQAGRQFELHCGHCPYHHRGCCCCCHGQNSEQHQTPNPTHKCHHASFDCAMHRQLHPRCVAARPRRWYNALVCILEFVKCWNDDGLNVRLWKLFLLIVLHSASKSKKKMRKYPIDLSMCRNTVT